MVNQQANRQGDIQLTSKQRLRLAFQVETSPPVQDATGRSEVVRTLEVTENRSSVLVNILSENCQLMYFDYIIYINYHEFNV